MFRKLLALEVAALASNEDTGSRPDRAEGDKHLNLREMFVPRTGNYGSMWSTRSFS